MKQTLILAVESSCDETAVAVVADGKEILSNVVATQIDVHKEFGGVIPEVASRIHVENISMVIEEALHKANVAMEDIDAVAVTQGPGLVGCLHIGVQAAKTLAWAFHKPLVPVHHIAGHIYANRLITDLKFPLLALVVSGAVHHDGPNHQRWGNHGADRGADVEVANGDRTLFCREPFGAGFQARRDHCRFGGTHRAARQCQTAPASRQRRRAAEHRPCDSKEGIADFSA